MPFYCRALAGFGLAAMLCPVMPGGRSKIYALEHRSVFKGVAGCPLLPLGAIGELRSGRCRPADCLQAERTAPVGDAAGIDRGRRKAHLHFFSMRSVELLRGRREQRSELADGIGKKRPGGGRRTTGAEACFADHDLSPKGQSNAASGFPIPASVGARSVSDFALPAERAHKGGKTVSALRSKWRARYSRIMRCTVNNARPAQFNRRHSEQTIQRQETISGPIRADPFEPLAQCLDPGGLGICDCSLQANSSFHLCQFKIADREIFDRVTRQQALFRFSGDPA